MSPEQVGRLSLYEFHAAIEAASRLKSGAVKPPSETEYEGMINRLRVVGGKDVKV